MAELGLDTDVVVVGSGFGGAVAALRFSEAGQRVVVLERGTWIERDGYHIDLDWFWLPHRNRFGMHDIRKRGPNILPWLGAGVGGGSHVYAGTLKRITDFSDYPLAVQHCDMQPYFEIAETMMGATEYPAYSPYSDCRATQLLFGVGESLSESDPELVEAYGPVNLAVSFAPHEGGAGKTFDNEHGARQRYYDPREQSLLGGDIDAKNTLDHNYLHKAQEGGAEIRPLSQVDRIEELEEGGYRVHYKEWRSESGALRRWRRKWFPKLFAQSNGANSITTKRLVLSAGTIGTTEILLRNRDHHKTLPRLSKALGSRYTTNGDFLSLVLPFRGVLVAWAGFIAGLVGAIQHNWAVLGAGALLYYGQLALSRAAFHPDLGTTNSDYIRFRGPDGEPGAAYIETGRYPTPLRLALAVALSIVGLYKPRRYRRIVAATNLLAWVVPPFALLARTWPIPLLKMGKDQALGTMSLDAKGAVKVDYDLSANREFYAHLDALGRKIAKSARAWWIPNLLFRIFKTIEVPHNQGGAPMSDDPALGVVDHAGRVHGYQDLMILDGSILPGSPGPNPALTILAVSERAMVIAIEQLARDEQISAEAADADMQSAG